MREYFDNVWLAARTACATPLYRGRVPRRSPARLRALRGLISNSTEDFRRAVYPDALRRRLKRGWTGRSSHAMVADSSIWSLRVGPLVGLMLSSDATTAFTGISTGARRSTLFFFAFSGTTERAPRKRILIDDLGPRSGRPLLAPALLGIKTKQDPEARALAYEPIPLVAACIEMGNLLALSCVSTPGLVGLDHACVEQQGTAPRATARR